jgi:hypothetical protein
LHQEDEATALAMAQEVLRSFEEDFASQQEMMVPHSWMVFVLENPI